jgi:uncharacterized protein YndB with AHSA1/START domain
MREQDWEGLTRIETSIDISRRPEDVFNYVTTPALWHTWHPATASVSDVPHRPLDMGETALEHIRAGWRGFDARWVVVACEPFREWVIETDSADGAARIRYRLEANDGGCRFERTLGYRAKRLPWSAFDSNLTRWVLGRQSARALRALKALLERNAPV